MRFLKLYLLLAILIVPTATAISQTGKLDIQAIPSVVKVEESVEFIVTTKLRGEPVSDAEIKIARVKPGETVESVMDAISRGEIGMTIGYTDSSGKLRYSFDDWGVYVVYASKERYLGALTTVEAKPLGRLHIEASIGEWDPGTCELEDLASMSIDEAMQKCSDKVILTVKVTDDAGNPVSGATVKIRGLESTQLTTDANGEAKTRVRVGTYFITAEKRGYAPGFELEGLRWEITTDQLREKIREKIEEAKSKVSVSVELEGVVIKPSGYLREVLKNIASKAEKRDLVSQLTQVDFEALKTYLLFSKDVKAIVVSTKEIPEAKVRLKGFGIGVIDHRGYRWTVFFTDPNSEVEIIDDKGTPVTVDKVLSNSEEYKFELLNFSTHCRSIALTILYEETDVAIPVSVGYISDAERTRASFLEQIIENAGKFNRSEKLSRKFIDEILEFESPKRIAIFRLKSGYWFDSEAYVKGLLLGVSDAKMLLSLLPENLEKIAIPENTKILLIEIDKIPKAEFVNIEDIRKSPEEFAGKIVAFQAVGEGVNVSTNQVLEKTLKKASATIPELAPAAAAAEANPIEVLIQAEVRWYPVIPNNRYQVIPAVSALSYEDFKRSPIEPVREAGKVSVIYGYVVTGERFGFEHPVVVIQDKKFVRNVSPSEIKADIRDLIERIKERIKERVEEGIGVGTGLEKPKFFHILPVIESGKPVTIEVGKSVERLKLNTKERLENVFVEVRELTILPENVPKLSGKVYVYLEVVVSAETGETEGEIEFKVSKEWLIENDVDKSSIVLKKYIESEGWITLETRIIREDENYVYYAAKTPSFSLYAITTKESTAEVTTITGITTTTQKAITTTTEKTPGFEAILGIAAITFAIRKMRK